MNSPIEEIKSRLDIVELIQSYVRLEKSGANFRACCPFHNEKTPSFFVSPARQIWHCFGCSKGGDQFKFIMEIEGFEFPEALKLLAQKAGVELIREDPRVKSERNRLYDICEVATRWFAEQLKREPRVNEYLSKRGLKSETISEFDIGFAPDGWRNLLNYLIAKGFREMEIERAGLAVLSPKNLGRGERYYDRFRNRIIFPISDANGRVLGFGGRIFEAPSAKHQATSNSNDMPHVANEHVAKYINTPQTMIYDKSRVLYGFDKAKQRIREKDYVVIVEGYMDTVMSHQAGVKNTVAVSGTALTPWQLKNLERLSKNMVGSFDMDGAGVMATKRSIDLASSFSFSRKIAIIPSGKDPADAVLADSASWVQAVEEAKPVVEFFIKFASSKFNKDTLEGKQKIFAMVLPEIKRIKNEIEMSHWVLYLSRFLETREEAIWKELQKIANPDEFSLPEENEIPSSATSRRKLLEERLLALVAHFPQMGQDLPPQNEYYAVFSNASHESLFWNLRGQEDKASVAVPADLKEDFRFRGEILAGYLNNPKDEFVKVAAEFERECVKEKLNQISKEISFAEERKDSEKLLSLLGEFKSLSARLK